MANEQQILYVSPRMEVLEIKVHTIICLSESDGNNSLYEKNLDENDFEVI